jgi:hypothetical protein
MSLSNSDLDLPTFSHRQQKYFGVTSMFVVAPRGTCGPGLDDLFTGERQPRILEEHRCWS